MITSQPNVFDAPDSMVFVPAIMGAGLVFSIAAVLRDVLFRGSRTSQLRRAQIRGRLVAASVVDDPEDQLLADARGAHVGAFALAGLVAVTFSVYVTIGATANFFRAGGYVNHIAWLWGGMLVVVAAAAAFALVCFAVALRPDDPPPWVWSTLTSTPLLGVDRVNGNERARWIVITALSLTTLLTVLATWPHVLEPIDNFLDNVVDTAFVARFDWLADVVGSTRLTIVIAVLVGIGTLRCKRFAWIFIVSVVTSLAVTTLIRWFVDRPRPVDGPFGPTSGSFPSGGGSFPSGHMVQTTLLAVLVPLAIHEVTRSARARRWSTGILFVCVFLVAISRIASEHHAPTDVIAGIAIGLAVGCWARLSLAIPEGHSECRSCVAKSGAAEGQPERPRSSRSSIEST